MKKIYHILLFAVLAASFAACGSDDADEAVSLKVIKSDVLFDANIGSGAIEVSLASVTATSDESWCKVTATGNTVKVDVESNEDFFGRNALVKISADGQTVSVVVTQQGAVFASDKKELLFMVATSGEGKIAISSSLPITVSSTSNWVQYTVTNNEIVINVDPTIAPRVGTLTVTNGTRSMDIAIKQTKLRYTDLLGAWDLSYTDDDGLSQVATVTIATKVANQSYAMTGLPIGAVCTMLFDEPTSQIIFQNPYYVGKFDLSGDAYLYICMSIGNSFSWDTAVQYAGSAKPNLPDLTYAFHDNGTWSGKIVTGLAYAFFRAQPPTIAGYIFLFDTLNNIVMVKQ